MTSVVRVEPLGVDLEVDTGETLMHAAERLGYRWPTLCHGHAVCTMCFIAFDEEPDAFEPAGPAELAALRVVGAQSSSAGKVLRLACQARVRGDTIVTKRGVRVRVPGDESCR
jgi:ferredoxin